LRVRIARGRSYASILVVPQRKTTLGRALHGRAAMARVGAPWSAMGSSPERGKRGKEEGRKEQAGRRREEKEKKRRRVGEKEREKGRFFKFGNFQKK
jgi:hypothetical protein